MSTPLWPAASPPAPWKTLQEMVAQGIVPSTGQLLALLQQIGAVTSATMIQTGQGLTGGPLPGSAELRLADVPAKHVLANMSDIAAPPIPTPADGLGWVRSEREVRAGAGLEGGGDLSTNRTLSLKVLNPEDGGARPVVDIYGRITELAPLRPSDLEDALGAVPPARLPTLDDLRQYRGAAAIALVSAHTLEADRGGGWFDLDLLDGVTADDNGTTIVDPLDRRWKRRLSDDFHAACMGVRVGLVADQREALQKAIDFAEAHKLSRVVLPAGYIRCDGPIYLGRANPLCLEGGPSPAHTYIGFTINQADDVTCLAFDNAPPGSDGVVLVGESDTRDGTALKNMVIARLFLSPADAGNRGLVIKGVTHPVVHNVLVFGFDVGIHMGTDDVGARATFMGEFIGLRSVWSASVSWNAESIVECRHYGCKAGGGRDYGLHLSLPPVIFPGANVISNGNQWTDCTFIADQGTVPAHNVFQEVGFYNTFTNCAFEAAAEENFKLDMLPAGGHAPSRVAVSLINPWFNNSVPGNTGAASFSDGNFQVLGGRFGGNAITGATIKINMSSVLGVDAFGATIIGANILCRAIAGIECNVFEGLTVLGCKFEDDSGTGLPCVALGSDAGRCLIAHNRFKTSHPRGYTNATSIVGGGNIFAGNVLDDNSSSDDYWRRSIGGVSRAYGGDTVRSQHVGTTQQLAATAHARYSADAGGVFQYLYKSRGATDGARGAVQSGDSVNVRRHYIDDGAADVEVVRETISADGVTGGAWEIYTKVNGGILTSRLKVNNTGALTHAGSGVFASYVKLGVFTVGTLPSAAVAGVGARAHVSDANAAAFNTAVTGGGSNSVPVFVDSASTWKIG